MRRLYQHALRPLFVLEIFVLIILLTILYQRQFALKTVLLNEQGLTGLLSMDHSIYRLTDGKEEKIPTTMQFNFLSPRDAAIYGTYPQKPDEQVLLLLTDRGSHAKAVDKSTPLITHVDQNQAGTYLLVTTTSASTPSAQCLSSKEGSSLNPCTSPIDLLRKDFAKKGASYRSYWNMNKDRELLIQESGDSNAVVSYDPWEKTPITHEAGYAQQEQGAADEKKRQFLTPEYSVWRKGPLTILTKTIVSATKKPRHLWYWIPSQSPIVWVTSYKFLFIKGKKSYVSDVRDRTISLLAPLPTDHPVVSSYALSIISP